MNQRILNRDGKLPDDGYYHIEALGEHVNHRAGVVQVIDAKAVASIVNRFAQEAAGENFAGQRVDKDHLSNSESNATEAMGWSKTVINRDDGLYSRVKWTPLGRPLIKPDNPDDEPAYKFFSTEYEPDECEVLGTRRIANRAYKVIRPLRLAGLALTNDPNNKGQHPISNRNPAASAERSENENQPAMKKVNTLLGLAEDASEDAAIAELQKIQNRATKAEGQVSTLTAERDTLLSAQVEADLEKYQNRYKPENRDKIKAALITNRAGTLELLDAIGAPAATEAAARITNRGTARTPAEIEAAKTKDKKEETRAARIQNRALELQKQKSHGAVKYPFATAFREAEAETPGVE